MTDNRRQRENEPRIPTMVNPITSEPEPFQLPPDTKVVPSVDPVTKKLTAPEMQDDITALPMVLPDFANNIQAHLVNQNLWPRWIYTDRRRYAQARAQGWRNATKADLKPGFGTLNPFEEEGGTKYINGDLILMLIDRRRYLSALRHKQQVAERLSEAPVQRAMSIKKGQADLGDLVNAINRQRQAQGLQPLMEVVNGNESHEVADLNSDPVFGQPGVAQKEIGRIGGTPDIGGSARR